MAGLTRIPTRRRLLVEAGLIVLLHCGIAAAQQPTSSAPGSEARALLERAVATYTRALDREDRDLRLEEFRRAERLFAQASTSGNGLRNPGLYTNLGNAALQAERFGPAILAYRRALLLDPNAPRALQNLDHTRALLPEWVPRPEPAGLLDSFFFWHRTLSRADRSLAAALSFGVAALLLALAMRLGRPALRNLAILPGLAWLVLLGSVVLDPRERARNEAVVIAEETLARAADSALSPSTFPDPLPGGVEVEILERRSPWLRIRLANGRDAWVVESSIAPVGFD